MSGSDGIERGFHCPAAGLVDGVVDVVVVVVFVVVPVFAIASTDTAEFFDTTAKRSDSRNRKNTRSCMMKCVGGGLCCFNVLLDLSCTVDLYR